MKTGYTISRASRKYPTFKILKGVNDMANMIVDNAKVMSKGQITLPKEIREQLGIGTGDRVTLICEGDQVVMMNAAVYAMKMLQGWDFTGSLAVDRGGMLGKSVGGMFTIRKTGWI